VTDNYIIYQLHSHRLRDPLAGQCDQLFSSGVWNYLHDQIWDYVGDPISTIHEKDQLEEDHAGY
jgi:hypothetical protein